MSDLQLIQNYIMHFFGKLPKEDIILMLIPRHVFEENKRRYAKNPLNRVINHNMLCNDQCQKSIVNCFKEVNKAYARSTERIPRGVQKDQIVVIAQLIALQYKNVRDLTSMKEDLLALEAFAEANKSIKQLNSLKTYMHTEIKDITKRIEDGNFKINNYILGVVSGSRGGKSWINGVPKDIVRRIEDVRNITKPIAKKIYKASECIRNISLEVA